jgi:hypothetical protein
VYDNTWSIVVETNLLSPIFWYVDAASWNGILVYSVPAALKSTGDVPMFKSLPISVFTADVFNISSHRHFSNHGTMD